MSSQSHQHIQVAEHSAQGIQYTMPFTSIMPGLSFHFREGFLEGISGAKHCLCTKWPAPFADLLIDALDVRQKHSGPWSATLRNTSIASSSASSQLLDWGSRSPSEHSGHASFHLPGQDPVCKSIRLCGGAVCYTRLYLWMVV